MMAYPSAFSRQELQHYSRHLLVPEIGLEGQQKLQKGRVLVVGAGGLGCPALQYLAAAGVGTIGIVDDDVIQASNLHRQILYGVSDIGADKVVVAKKRLREINPHITVRTYHERLTAQNAPGIVADYDIVLDGTDNFPTRYLVNDLCVLQNKTNVYGSIFRFEGQVAVFNHLKPDGTRGPNYRDLFPVPPPPGMVPSCAEAGVLGVLPGIIGSLQASEVIKILTGIGDPLDGKLLLFDALAMMMRKLTVPRADPRPVIDQLIDYEVFCGVAGDDTSQPAAEEITVQQLKQMQDDHANFQLVDVREPYEYEISNLAGDLIPLSSLATRYSEIRQDKPVVVHCRSGQRSAKAIAQLREKHGFNNLVNLKGGLLAYAEEIDSEVAQY